MQNLLTSLYLKMDLLLISPFRWLDNPVAGFFLGTMLLAIYCILLGKITGFFVEKSNASLANQENRRMVRNHNLSLRALLAKDKAAFKGFNKDANDAFGKYFFNRLACGMATLWPAFFGLAWLDTRFRNVDFMFPGIERAVGFSFIFILLFILLTILSNRIVKTFFKPAAMAGENFLEPEPMLTLKDLAESNN